MKVDFDKLKSGDKFFNRNRDHIGVVVSVTEERVVYVWSGPCDSWTHVPCQTSQEDFQANAISWHELSSLEQELL
jgi:hypothetical protein